MLAKMRLGSTVGSITEKQIIKFTEISYKKRCNHLPYY